MTDDSHYANWDGMTEPHDCDDPNCLTRGLPSDDLKQLAFSLAAYDAADVDPDAIRIASFRADDGLYVLLTTPWNGGRAVIGALYTPTLYAALRASGFTVSSVEADGGVN